MTTTPLIDIVIAANIPLHSQRTAVSDAPSYQSVSILSSPFLLVYVWLLVRAIPHLNVFFDESSTSHSVYNDCF
jgi:hypothetical protein